MDKRTDINTASFAYSVSLLRIRISGYPPGAGTKRQSIHTAVLHGIAVFFCSTFFTTFHHYFISYDDFCHACASAFMQVLVVYSPGGMPDGTKIQERNIDTVPSTRRNPVLADIFSRLGYMERQGSGLNKIRNAYRSAENYTPDKEPVFYSDRVEFTVTLKNLNFSASENEAKSEAKNEAENYRLTELEERLCNLLLEYPELTQSEIRERLDLSRSKVQRMMRKLTEDGIIIREGSRRKGYWTIHL